VKVVAEADDHGQRRPGAVAGMMLGMGTAGLGECEHLHRRARQKHTERLGGCGRSATCSILQENVNGGVSSLTNKTL
jgi:hypothetical protein